MYMGRGRAETAITIVWDVPVTREKTGFQPEDEKNISGIENLWPRDPVPVANAKTDSCAEHRHKVWRPGSDLGKFPACLVDSTLWCQTTFFSFTFFFTQEVASNTCFAAKLGLTNITVNFHIGQSPNTFSRDTMVCIWQAIRFKNAYFISWCSAITKSNYFWQHIPIGHLIRHSFPGWGCLL